MIIKWHGHSCFQLKSGDYSLVIDPYTGVNGWKDPDITANSVFSSHGHWDHNYLEAVKLCQDSAEPPFTVKKIPCFHDKVNGRARGENLIHIFTAEDMSVAHMGDLGHILSNDQINEIGKCDALLISVGGVYTIDGDEAFEIAKAIKPRVIIPMHYRYNNRGLENISGPDIFLNHFPPEFIKEYDEPIVELTHDTESHVAFLK